MKNIYLLILLSIAQYSFSQELIRNGSFEERKPGTDCPNGPWNQPNSTQGFPRYWSHGPVAPVIGTPDYLQTCATVESGYHPEHHIYGQETPRTGNSIAGIIAYDPFTADPFGEYLIQELENPLVAGQQYYVEFYVSLSDLSKYSLSGLGIYFTNNYNDFNSPSGSFGLFNLHPQIPSTFPNSTPYSSTSGWTKISGYFTPSISGIKYIAVGEYSGITTTRSISTSVQKAYYYIDDVSIVPVCPGGPPTGISSYNSNCSGNSFNVLNTSLSAACTANQSIYFSYRITDPRFSNFVFTPVSVPSGASWSYSGGNLYMTVNTPPTSGARSATIALSASGPCGPLNINFTSTAFNYGGGYGYRYSYFPNPTSETLVIEQTFDEEENSQSGRALKESSSDNDYFILCDFNNNKVVLEGPLSQKTEIDVSKLKRGRYILKIQKGKDKPEAHQVVIK